MGTFRKIMISFSLALAMGAHLHVNAHTLPYQLTKVASGYKVSSLPPEVIDDFTQAASEELVMSLVDPVYGTSSVRGYGHIVDEATLVMSTEERLRFHPDFNRTYLVFELKNPPAGGGDCSGCTLSNKNLKGVSPQMCWCFSKLSAAAGNKSESSCRTRVEDSRSLSPPE